MMKCRDCQQPLDLQQQANSPRIGGFMTLVTCRNPDCLLHGMTREQGSYIKLTEAELEPYRVINRMNKEASA